VHVYLPLGEIEGARRRARKDDCSGNKDVAALRRPRGSLQVVLLNSESDYTSREIVFKATVPSLTREQTKASRPVRQRHGPSAASCPPESMKPSRNRKEEKESPDGMMAGYEARRGSCSTTGAPGTQKYSRGSG